MPEVFTLSVWFGTASKYTSPSNPVWFGTNSISVPYTYFAVCHTTSNRYQTRRRVRYDLNTFTRRFGMFVTTSLIPVSDTSASSVHPPKIPRVPVYRTLPLGSMHRGGRVNPAHPTDLVLHERRKPPGRCSFKLRVRTEYLLGIFTVRRYVGHKRDCRLAGAIKPTANTKPDVGALPYRSHASNGVCVHSPFHPSSRVACFIVHRLVVALHIEHRSLRAGLMRTTIRNNERLFLTWTMWIYIIGHQSHDTYPT